MSKKHYYLMIDTEATNSLEQPLQYDIGMQIIDRNGTVYEEYSFVNQDIFYDQRDLMYSAYYANKIPNYEKDLLEGSRILSNTNEIRYWIYKKCKEYDVHAIIAHNAPFDVRALNTTLRYVTKSEKRFCLPYGVEIWDTMRMAQDTICKQKRYQKFCEENGYLTKNGQVRKTAEILYRYLINNTDFVESHTGLEDVNIERQIFMACLRQHKKMRRNAYNN